MKKELYESSHDIEHSLRVANNAFLIAKGQPDADLEVLEIASLLHDIAKARADKDITGKLDHCAEGAQMAGKILQSLGFSNEKAEKVKQAILYHREFMPKDVDLCIEAKIVYDAGILENLGAIGIARMYMVAGEFQEKLYNDEPIEEYILHNVQMPVCKVIDYSIHAPNMEFLLNWQNSAQLLYTKAAKDIAAERIAFSKMFFLKLKEELGTNNLDN